MSVRIRSANLDSDRAALIELFRRHLTPNSDAKRFTWLYCNSPHGAASVWVACDDSSGGIVGAVAGYPRKMCSDGIERTCLLLGDFCMEEKYRSLGPAVELQRACFQQAAKLPFEFCYDFPSPGMMAVYKRLGVQQTGALVRWAKPLRVAQKLQRALGSKTIARALDVPAKAVLSLWGSKGDPSACALDVLQGRCGKEFNLLEKQLRAAPGLRTVRSADYLNWRFLDHPNATHEILTARRKGALIGYTVYALDHQDATIVDLSSVEEPDVILRLLAGAVRRLSWLGAMTASLSAGEAHPWIRWFQRAGFRRRESSPMVVYSLGGPAVAGLDFKRNWYVMRGERDI